MSLFDGYEIHQEITSVIKIYPDFVRLTKFKTPYLARRFDYDERRYGETKKHVGVVDSEDYELISLRRAKTILIDLTLTNHFDLFATFTFAKDRQDVDAKKRQMAYWLNNQRILHGKFLYLVVPEFHKDKKALHFHGLFSGYNGNLVDSGHVQKGRVIYNILSYRAGFTTAVKIDDLEKVSSYVTKYITKDMPRFRNKQRYWRSNGLKLPLKIINPRLSESDIARFKSIYSNKHQEIYEMRGELSDNDIARIAVYGIRREDDLRATSRYPLIEHEDEEV